VGQQGWGPAQVGGGARAGKDRAGGEMGGEGPSEGKLDGCIMHRFTLIYKNSCFYTSKTI
jgi:hypothetical protein